MATQEEESRRIVQSIARNMLCYLDNSGTMKVDCEDLKEQALSPSERSVDVESIVRQARSEQNKKLFQIFQKSGSTRNPSHQYGEMGGTLENAYSSGEGMPRARWQLKKLAEKQEVLADVMQGKMCLQKIALKNLRKNISKN